MRISDWSSDVCSSDLLKTGHIDGRPLTYNEAVEAALGKSHSDFRTGEVLDFLPYYGEMLSREIPPGTLDPNDDDATRWGKITNPTVHIGLNQLRRLLNAIIRVHGRPEEISVELARHLQQSEQRRDG